MSNVELFGTGQMINHEDFLEHNETENNKTRSEYRERMQSEDSKHSETQNKTSLHKHYLSQMQKRDDITKPSKICQTNESVESSLIENNLNINFESSEYDDEYTILIKEMLDSDAYYDNSNEDNFAKLYQVLYGQNPQVETDRNLSLLLNGDTLSPRDMILSAQKHFNDYGGFIVDR